MALFAELPQIPTDQVGGFVLCLILVAYLLILLKKLFGWEGPTSTVTDLKREVKAVSAQVSRCATKEEMVSLKEEINSKYDKLEEYTHARAHDTINAVNSLHLNVEKMRAEIIREMAASNQRLENRIHELLLERTKK